MSLSRHIENQLGKGIKKHLFARIMEQKSTDNCYLISVDNKNSFFIPEQRKNRLNHFLKITNGLVPKERICGVSSSTKYELLLVLFCRCRFRSLSLSLRFFSCHRSSRHHVALSELLKICQKLQYREKSSSKQIKNKHSALSLYPSDA